MKTAIAYLLAITAAEIITTDVHLVFGMVSHIVILAALILHTALTSQPGYQQLLLSLALVPLIRIISLSMPLTGIPQVWWYPIIYTPLLVAAWQVVRLLGYKLREIGFQIKQVPFQLAVALTGFGFGVLEYLILAKEAETTGPILQQNWALSASVLMLTTGFVEELIFRGVMQRSAVQLFGWWGIVYVSLIFAIVHWIHGSPLDIVFVFVVAMFFGWAVKKTGSLLGVTLSHGIANIVLFLVAPLLF